MQICPSILEHNIDNYFKTIDKLSSFFNWFQLDFTDGEYVKNKTANFFDFIKKTPNNQSLITNIYFDFHLMVKNYQEIINKLNDFLKLKKLKIKNVFIHYDLKPKKDLLYDNKNQFIIGLVLNPDDQVKNLAYDYDINNIKAIQIMSVYPGAQGNPFIVNSIKKIEQLRQLGYRYKIFLDGAINDKTIDIIKSQKFLPDVICPGSYFSKAKKEEINEKIKNLIK
ncbi:MAG: D-allulose-6-phosphate 3-epimerase [Candidatus Microgenomates bacterium]